MKLERGMLISTDNVWYVVVNVRYSLGKVWLECICDNANNRYTWEPQDVTCYLSLDEIRNRGYMGWEARDYIHKDVADREIPDGLILDILLGKQNDRFDDYEESANEERKKWANI